MTKSKNGVLLDSWIMFKRGLLIAMRQPEALIIAAVTPFLMMVLFGKVFGNIVNIENFSYIDFIIPGVIIQSMAQASQHSAINVTTDITKGIIDRFRSMSTSKSSVLIGHIGAGMVRNAIATIVIIGTAFLIGFEPQASAQDWLVIVGLLLLVNIAISSLAVLCGLIAKTPEASSGLMFPFFILPYISSGFAPVESLPDGIRWFAEVQPLTPMIDSIRAFMMGTPAGDSLWLTMAWCAGIIIVAFVLSMQLYKRKVS